VPRPIVVRISADVDRIMADPAFRKRMYTDRGVEPAAERLDAFARFVGNERKVARRIVKASGWEPK
jgi:tripartite-type tricarboxylate transporter receptor subunit TctC